MKQSLVETLVSSQTNGNTIVSSTTSLSILPPAAKFTFPPNYFNEIGKTIRITAGGMISANATATLTLGVVFGSANVAFGGANTIAMPAKTATAAANLGWMFTGYLTTRTIGTSANFMATGTFSSNAVNSNMVAIPTVVSTGVAFDATSTQTLDFFVKFGGASSAVNITCSQFILESLN